MELSVHIFSFLQLNTVFRCQVVSKTWATLLRSDEVLSSLLNRRNVRKVPELKFPADMSRHQKLIGIAQSINAYQHGRPFSRISGTWQMPSRFKKLRFEIFSSDWPEYRSRFAFCKDRLAWIDSESDDQVTVLSVETGNQMAWRPVNPGRLRSILISDNLLVASSHTVVYVHEFATGSDYSIPLPSTIPLPLTIIDLVYDTVAILLLQSSCRPQIITWTLSEKVVHEFPASMETVITRESLDDGDYSIEMLAHTYRIMIDPLESSVLCLTAPLAIDKSNGEGGRHILFERYDLQGRQMAKGHTAGLPGLSWELIRNVAFSSKVRGINAPWYYEPSRILADRAEQPFKQLAAQGEGKVPTIPWAISRLVYDLDHNNFRFDKWEEDENRSFEQRKTYVFNGNTYIECGTYASPAGWGALHASSDECGGILEDRSWRRGGLDYVRDSGHAIESAHRDWRPDCATARALYRSLKCCWLLGDERFLIRTSFQGYAVYCFDPYVALAKEDELYKYKRMKAGECRAGQEEQERKAKRKWVERYGGGGSE